MKARTRFPRYCLLRKHWRRGNLPYAHLAPPAWPVDGTPAALRISTSSPTIARADGTDDVQVVVSVIDAAGRRLSNSPPVHLVIESGPGELPTGRAIDFKPDSDIVIRDGEAAISMRSWQSGTAQLRATSPGLKAATITVRTLQGPVFVPGKTPLVGDRPYAPFVPTVSERPGDGVFGLNNPTFSSSNAAGHSSRLTNDGNPTTYWAPAAGDSTGTVTLDMERLVEVHRLTLTFPQAAAYGFVAEIESEPGKWQKLAEQIEGQEGSQTRTVETEAVQGRNVRITLRVPTGAIAGLSELQMTGMLRTD
jgi:hypothetical protein